MLPSTHELGITLVSVIKKWKEILCMENFPTLHPRHTFMAPQGRLCSACFKGLLQEVKESEIIQSKPRVRNGGRSSKISQKPSSWLHLSVCVSLVYTYSLPKVWGHHGSNKCVSFVHGLRKSRWQCGKGWQSYLSSLVFTALNTQYNIVKEKVDILLKILAAAEMRVGLHRIQIMEVLTL